MSVTQSTIDQKKNGRQVIPHKLLKIQLQLVRHTNSYCSQGGSSGKVYEEPARTSERNLLSWTPH